MRRSSAAAASARGIVVRDFLRRLVARTLTQQFGSAFDDACRPHQFALFTQDGTETLGHFLQASIDMCPLWVNGIGAFNLINRNAMPPRRTDRCLPG